MQPFITVETSRKDGRSTFRGGFRVMLAAMNYWHPVDDNHCSIIMRNGFELRVEESAESVEQKVLAASMSEVLPTEEVPGEPDAAKRVMTPADLDNILRLQPVYDWVNSPGMQQPTALIAKAIAGKDITIGPLYLLVKRTDGLLSVFLLASHARTAQALHEAYQAVQKDFNDLGVYRMVGGVEYMALGRAATYDDQRVVFHVTPYASMLEEVMVQNWDIEKSKIADPVKDAHDNNGFREVQWEDAQAHTQYVLAQYASHGISYSKLFRYYTDRLSILEVERLLARPEYVTYHGDKLEGCHLVIGKPTLLDDTMGQFDRVEKENNTGVIMANRLRTQPRWSRRHDHLPPAVSEIASSTPTLSNESVRDYQLRHYDNLIPGLPAVMTTWVSRDRYLIRHQIQFHQCPEYPGDTEAFLDINYFQSLYKDAKDLKCVWINPEGRFENTDRFDFTRIKDGVRGTVNIETNEVTYYDNNGQPLPINS
jgi:hypothetical protein